jgi:hypothetical protein
MSLSPFDSFQSRFVTYLLNCPRIFILCLLFYFIYFYGHVSARLMLCVCHEDEPGIPNEKR